MNKIIDKFPSIFKEENIRLAEHCIDFIKHFLKLSNVKPSKYAQNREYILYKSVNTVIVSNSPKVLLYYYFTLFKLSKVYDVNYGNGVFNEFFIELYHKMPSTINALFIELPNYQFFCELLKYIEVHYDNSTIYKRLIYRLCISFVNQLEDDVNEIHEAKKTNRVPIISNACYFAPYQCKASKYIAYRLFIVNKINKIKKIKKENLDMEYETLVETLTNKLVELLKDKRYQCKNYVDFDELENACFKRFKRNYYYDVCYNMKNYTMNDINRILYDKDLVVPEKKDYGKMLNKVANDIANYVYEKNNEKNQCNDLCECQKDDVDEDKQKKKKIKFCVQIPVTVPDSK